LSNLGYKVVGVDRDNGKIRAVNEGRAPFYEPGLKEIIRECLAGGRLSATPDIAEAMADSEMVLVCVGTPSEENGNFGLEQLLRVCEEIARTVPSRADRLIVAIRSTVYPGTCEDVVAPILGHAEKVSVVDNPEFMREGTAIRDFMEPSLLVIGGSDPSAVQAVAGVYSKIQVEPCLVSTRAAEMIKYASNSFHAVKVAFANEMGALCDRMQISSREVMETFCQDTALNISAAYLKPGFAFGGSCLSKDLRALIYRGNQLNLKLPLLESVLPSNEEQLRRAIGRVMALRAEKIGVFGLAFKENTDDLRESPVVSLLEHLIGKGRDIRVFDPHIQIGVIFGSNRNFVMQMIPHIGQLMCSTLAEMLDWADSIVVAQKPSAVAREVLRATGLPLVDLVEAFHPTGGR
jgi:GDP-mannose 6-dehydrogenase